MFIVVEGIDNSGKSTLIAHLSKRLPTWHIQPSEGPPHHPGEMNERLKRYSLLGHTIFDRHPVVSQSIYRIMRTHRDTEEMRDDLVLAFYASRPLFIYCDPVDRRMEGHVVNPGVDTEEHLGHVHDNFERLLSLYRSWAIRHAHIIYRIGDSMDFVADCVIHQREISYG